MKALTIRNPHAHLIAIGLKRVENRSRPISYRGPFLIHASQSRDDLHHGDERRYPELIFGAHVAVADLVGCVTLENLPDSYQDNLQYAHGPYCWLLANVRRLEHYIPASGSQGLWTPLLSDWREAMAQVDMAAHG